MFIDGETQYCSEVNFPQLVNIFMIIHSKIMEACYNVNLETNPKFKGNAKVLKQLK